MSKKSPVKKKAPAQAPAAVNWYWLDGSRYVQNSTEISAQLEEAYEAEEDGLDIAIFGKDYYVDFEAMTQTNTATGFSRQLRRGEGSSSSSSTTTSSSSSASIKAPIKQKKSEVYKTPPITKQKVDLPDAKEEDWKGQDCSICMDGFEQKDADAKMIVKLKECVKHCFHKDCISDYINEHTKCPKCGYFYGTKIGPGPDGEMIVSFSSSPLPGNPHCGMISISFQMPRGKQDKRHPNPGKEYYSDSRSHYMPDDEMGNKILGLFIKAWNQRLLFNVGYSLTRQEDNCIIYNGVHMKTNTSGGPTGHGWPDPTYYVRVQTELSEKGIHMLEDLTADEIKKLKIQSQEEQKQPEKGEEKKEKA